MKQAFIADDEPVLRQVMRQVAERQGWTAVECADGEALIERIDELDAGDLLFLDLQMPFKDGFDVVWALSAHACEAEIFLMTGGIPANAETAETLASSIGLKVGGVLLKPTPLKTLMEIFAARSA